MLERVKNNEIDRDGNVYDDNGNIIGKVEHYNGTSGKIEKETHWLYKDSFTKDGKKIDVTELQKTNSSNNNYTLFESNSSYSEERYIPRGGSWRQRSWKDEDICWGLRIELLIEEFAGYTSIGTCLTTTTGSFAGCNSVPVTPQNETGIERQCTVEEINLTELYFESRTPEERTEFYAKLEEKIERLAFLQSQNEKMLDNNKNVMKL